MPVSIIAGNWKMHKTVAETVAFIERLIPQLSSSSSRIWIAPPFTAIHAAVLAAKGSQLAIGAQNVSEQEAGAFTGEISANMLKEVGANFVLIGHSERRTLFNENGELIRKKLLLSIHHGLSPILCIGETLSQREKGSAREHLRLQLEEALNGINSHSLSQLIIAYEPIWAIGTGRTATPEIAGEAHEWIRQLLASLYNKNFADQVSLIYGGSVKPSNILDLLGQAEINGVLVGGASLEIESFIELIKQGKKS